MTWLPSKTDESFLLNKLVVLGWLAIIFRPRHRLTHISISGIAIFFTFNCLVTLWQLIIRRIPTTSNMFDLSNLLGLYWDAFNAMATSTHIRVTELMVGLWMAKDFYTRFTCAYHVKPKIDGSVPRHFSWNEESFVFTGILIITYLLSPLGVIIYFLAARTYFSQFTAREPINWRRPQSLKTKKTVSAVKYQFLSTRIIRFGDSLPEQLRTLYRTVRGLSGILVGLFLLGFYAAYTLYCHIFQRKRTIAEETYPRWPPRSVRAHTIELCWRSTITPVEDRNWWWKVKSYWLQLCTFILFSPCGEDPLALFRAIQKDFSASLGKPTTDGFFPFGDGVGVGSHKYVKAYLESHDPLIIKDFQTIGWSVSTSLIKYCDLTTIFLPNPSHPMPDRYLLSRKIVHHWLAAFPHTMVSLNDLTSKRCPVTYRQLCRIVPRLPNGEPSRDVVYRAVGETIFYLATGGGLTGAERDAYIDCVKNPFTFLPDWFNFLIAGNYKENMGYDSYGTFQSAFARHVHGPALKAAFEAAAGYVSKSEVLRLITSTFCLGAAPAPAKITANAVQRLWSDQSNETSANEDGKIPEKMVDLFYENPRNFIKECARLNPILSMVSVVSNENIARDVKTHTGADLPPNTRIHCSLTDANHDPIEFTSPHEFNPRRSAEEMGKIITWNATESAIEGKSEEARPPRYCPGHDLSLQVMEFVASRFAPMVISTKQTSQSEGQINNNQSVLLIHDDKRKVEIDILPSLAVDQQLDEDESQAIIVLRELNSRENLNAKTDQLYLSSLDGYTRLIMELSRIALQSWNERPPRAIDICEPSNLPTQDLHLKRVEGVRYVPTWDEDDRSDWHFHTKLINNILNSKLWPFEDLELQFNSVDDMIAWRWKHFPSMPAPNNPQWFGDSDELMSRFAFFGLACHHTRKLDVGMDSMELHTATLTHSILKTAHYVNDMTALSLFTVRAPFERYGAAAYFDGDRRLIGIYLSHRNELVIPLKNCNGIDNEWTYAKYMWRSSALALVTIRDHLLTTHFIESNTLTHISREFLPAAHPLRIFLKPFTYRTVTINHSAATSLVNQGGLCHRIWGFEFDEFLKLCDYVVANYRFRIMPDWISDNMKLEQNDRSQTQSANKRCKSIHTQGETDTCVLKEQCPNCGYIPEDFVELDRQSSKDSQANRLWDEKQSEWAQHYPIADDLPKFWKIVRDYVRRFFEVEYGKEESEEEKNKCEKMSERSFMSEPCERRFIDELCKPLGLNGIPSRAFLIDVLAQLICACTGIHEHVGQVSDYLFDPRFIGTKMRRDLPSLLPSVQNYSLMLVLTVLTAMKMPGLMGDWSHLIPRIATDDQEGKAPSTITEDQVKSHLDNYYLFKQQLGERMAEIDERHRNPDNFPFQSFNPNFMECSVSV